MRRRTFVSMAILAGFLSAMGTNSFAASSADEAKKITVYKDPNCGCCGNWIKHLEGAGFQVTAHNREDMGAVKAAHGVPEALHSCHTGLVDGYVIEGHVPAADIMRFLAERPKAQGPKALGLSVPGMPMGSPGMEYGDERDAYDVILFAKDGKQTVFESH